jgi:site-specific DNA recombinase
VTEETFALAEDLLERNKRTSPRRTVEPTLLQGMVSCRKCGYALYRTSTRSSARKITYYRCLGSDRYRHLPGPVCDTRPIPAGRSGLDRGAALAGGPRADRAGN